MKLRLKQTININEVEVFRPEGHDRKIMFDGGIWYYDELS